MFASRAVQKQTQDQTPSRAKQTSQDQTPGLRQSENVLESSPPLHRYLGNSYVQAMSATDCSGGLPAPSVPLRPSQSGILQRKCACSNHTMAGGECNECRKKRSGSLQRAATNHTQVDAAPPIVHEVLRSPGQPLDGETRTWMGARFARDWNRVQTLAPAPGLQRQLVVGPPDDHYEQEADRIAAGVSRVTDAQHPAHGGSGLDAVRVHSDPRAAESAQAVNALAYTVGSHIVFGPGQYAPGTSTGRRLLAHELTHVAQQGSGTGPRLQRQPAPDVNKSAKFIEDTYRSGARQLNDPTLSQAASNVRRCREEGGYYCEILVTDDDINSMYAEWSLIESVYDRETADKAILDHKLREVSQRATGVKKQEAAAQGQAAQYSVAVGGLTALAPSTAPAPTGLGTLPNWSAGTANTNVAVANSNIAAAQSTAAVETGVLETTAPGAVAAPVTAVAVAGVALLVVWGIIVTVQLGRLGEFKKKLIAAGYKYLPSPRGVCMHNCHQGSQNLPRTFDFPEPVFPVPRNPFDFPVKPFGPRSGPLIPTDLDDIADLFPRAVPRLKPDRKEDKRKGCKIYPAYPRGGNPEHDALAAFVTGAPVEYLVITPEGKSKRFDGMDELGVLYDVKTRHDWLRILGLPDVVLTFPRNRSVSFGTGRLRAETNYEQEVAKRCGHDFHLATNNLQVVQDMREILGDIITPDKIELVDFPRRRRRRRRG
jgi:hypothetical protein